MISSNALILTSHSDELVCTNCVATKVSSKLESKYISSSQRSSDHDSDRRFLLNRLAVGYCLENVVSAIRLYVTARFERRHTHTKIAVNRGWGNHLPVFDSFLEYDVVVRSC